MPAAAFADPAAGDPCCRPIRQHATGRQGLYRTLMVEGRRMALDEFRDMAREPLNVAPRNAEPEELERQFWRNVTLNPPLYGAWCVHEGAEHASPGWDGALAAASAAAGVQSAVAAAAAAAKPGAAATEAACAAVRAAVGIPCCEVLRCHASRQSQPASAREAWQQGRMLLAAAGTACKGLACRWEACGRGWGVGPPLNTHTHIHTLTPCRRRHSGQPV